MSAWGSSLGVRRGLDVAIVALAAVLVFVWAGHRHRYDVDVQLAPRFDGVKTYRYREHPADAFDPSLYDEIRSVADAAERIRAAGPYANETELLEATYNLVRSRFVHHMYPRHTFLTNPALRLLEVAFPDRSYDSMALADMKLRHAVGVPCGGAATTFVEVFRAVGGRAQFVTYPNKPGHQIAEAQADGRTFTVDADLETLAPYSVLEFAADPGLIERYYPHRAEWERKVFREVFAQKPHLSGYDGPPTGSPRGYAFQAAVEILKFAVPSLGILVCIALRWRWASLQQRA